MAKYSDLDFFLTKNELTSDISFKKDVYAVAQSISNITLTRKGEKPFSPEFGSDLSSGLQTSVTDIELDILKTVVRSQIQSQEPRSVIDNIEFTKLPEGFKVDISFHLTDSQQASGTLSLTI
jgi:phage baseplate assembly protein W